MSTAPQASPMSEVGPTPASTAHSSTLTLHPTIPPQTVDMEKQPATPAPVIPDGGFRAWLHVAGASHLWFATFGFVNSWGIWQEYYQEQKWPELTPSTISWIGSLQYFLILAPALLMGRFLDTGKWRIPFYIAVIIFPVSLIITAEIKQFWQAVLSQGLLFGLSAGFLFPLCIQMTGHWFKAKRAYAMGIIAAVGQIGGVVFPVLVRNCLNRVGFQWTLRIAGLVCLYFTLFAAFTMRANLPPKQVSGGLVNPAAFKSVPYTLYSLAMFVVFASLYVPVSYFGVSGRDIGLGDFSSYLVAIGNVGSVLGRIAPAIIADRYGPVNLIIPALLCAMATTFAWPFALSEGSLIAVSILNGFFQGSFISLFAPGIAQLGGLEDIGRRIGMIMTIASFGALIANPISGQILVSSSFHEVSYYAGFMLLLGTTLFFALRWVQLGSLVGKL